MTLREVIDRVDDLKPNVYDETHKARWISELDARIYQECFLTHEGNPYTTVKPSEEEEDYIDYTRENEEEKIYLEFPYQIEKASEITLLAEFPHDEMYISYLEARIDQYNNDTGRYQNNSAMFNSLYNDYSSWFNRTHMPVERGKYEPSNNQINPLTR